MAERINGIPKGEGLERCAADGLGHAERPLDAVMKMYSGQRRIMGIGTFALLMNMKLMVASIATLIHWPYGLPIPHQILYRHI